jgi:hypothetical protein
VSSPSACTSCLSGYYLTETRKCECQPGFFLEDALCKACGTKCYSCFNRYDFCLTCNPGFTMDLPGSCVCAPGSFVTGLICSACAANC